jgi:alpha-ketoglutarate-dependent taurine dioxygenase
MESRALDRSFAREVVGLRLWEPVDDQTINDLRDLWAHHPVLVFRRQALSEDELAGFSALFGPLERIVRTDWASPVRPEVGVISSVTGRCMVNPSEPDPVAWGLSSVPGSALGRHLMGFERSRSANLKTRSSEPC